MPEYTNPTPDVITETDVEAALDWARHGDTAGARSTKTMVVLAAEVIRLRESSRKLTNVARRVGKTVELADHAIRVGEDKLGKSTVETRNGKDALYALVRAASAALKAAKRSAK